MADTQVTFDIVTRGADRSARDFRRLGGAADDTGKRFRRLSQISTRTAKVAGAALGGAIVATAVGLGKAAKAAADEEQEMAVLANTLRKATKATDDQVDSAESWITQMQNATGVADGDLRPALGKLVTATGNITRAQDLLKVALDISAARGKSLSTVVEALGKGALGTTGGLSRLGLATKDAAGKALTFDQILKNAADTMGGSAAAAADTAAGRYRILKARFDDLVETVGYKVLPILNSLLKFTNDKLIPALGDFAAWFRERVLPTLRQVADYVDKTVIPNLRRLAVDIVPALQYAADRLVGSLQDLRAAFTVSTGSGNKLGGSLHDVQVIALLLSAEIKIVATNIRVLAAVVRAVLTPLRVMASLLARVLELAQKVRDTVPSIPKAPGVGDIINKAKSLIPGFADGGTVTRSGLAWVGERGPELVKLPGRSTVYDHQASMRAASGGLNIEHLEVHAAPGERAERSVPRALTSLMYRVGTA